jgi:endonuclease/exonuclease/phosphatase family metal-dependent hydrolase
VFRWQNMNLGKNVLKILFFSMNVVVAGLFLMTLIAARISPEKMLLPAFLSLGLPLYIIANVIFVVFWLLFKKWFFLLSLLTLLVGIDAVRVSIPLNYGAQKRININDVEGISLITYNTQGLHMMQAHTAKKPNPVIKYLLESFPDILCIQEFAASSDNDHLSKDDLERLFSVYPYSYVHFHTDAPWWSFGVATFSKYPIVNKGLMDLDSYHNTAIFTDIQLGDSVVRIYNCHLESNKLTENDKLMAARIKGPLDPEMLAGTTLHLSRKLGAAYRIRARQADILADHMAQTNLPVMVVGDFNDVPYSYVYTQIRGDMKDVFQEMGFGFDYTFNEWFFKFRIDHILYHPSIELKAFKLENEQKGSDHFPLFCKFKL